MSVPRERGGGQHIEVFGGPVLYLARLRLLFRALTTTPYFAESDSKTSIQGCAFSSDL